MCIGTSAAVSLRQYSFYQDYTEKNKNSSIVSEQVSLSSSHRCTLSSEYFVIHHWQLIDEFTLIGSYYNSGLRNNESSLIEVGCIVEVYETFAVFSHASSVFRHFVTVATDG